MVRREEPRDRAAVAAVHRAAFSSERHPGIVDALRGTDRWLPEGSLVYEEDGEIVGHVLVSEWDLGDGRVPHLGPIGVLPRTQGRGVGSALMHAAIEEMRALGYPVLILWGDPRYYARFGFEDASGLGLEAPAGYESGFQALPLGARENVPRGRIEYLAAFA